MKKLSLFMLKVVGGLLAMASVLVGLAMAAAPAAATTPGTTTHNTFTITNPATSTAVTGTVSFKVATTAAVKSVLVNLPNFSGASPTVSGSSGLGGDGNLTPSITGTGGNADYTVVLTLTTATTDTANVTVVSFAIGGITTPSTSGNRQVTITTKDGSSVAIDSGKTLVSIGATNSTKSVNTTVSQSLTVTIGGAASYSFTVDPAGPTTATSTAYSVSYSSNAKNGVSVGVVSSGPLTGAAYGSSATIPASSGTFGSTDNTAGAPAVNTWGINVDGTTNAWIGIGTTAANDTGLGTSGPFTNKSESHIIGVSVNYSTPADNYTTQLMYIFTPNF